MYDRERRDKPGQGTRGSTTPAVPGKRTLVETQLPAAGAIEPYPATLRDEHAHAAAGVGAEGGTLPFHDDIQRAFGAHDIGSVRAHTGAAAINANTAMGSHAYARGNHIAFGGSPDLHTAAHEAAHVVQQRAGVNLDGGVGADGDAYEQQANAIADAVVAGGSAEALLATMTPSSGVPATAAVQHQRAPRSPSSAAPTAGAATAAPNSTALASPAAAAATPGVTSATTVAAPASPRPSSGAASSSTSPGPPIAQQFPQGITVAIALRAEEPEQFLRRILARGTRPKLGATLDRNREQLNASAAVTRLNDARRAAAGQPDPDMTDAQLLDLGRALAANDRAFGRAAAAFAQGHRIVGGDPASPTVGQPMMFGEDDDAAALIRALSHAVGPLPGSSDPGNIRHLAIFTHGWHDGLRLGSRFHGGASGFVAQLSSSLTHDVTIGMYGCSAASDAADGSHSFAQNVTEGLAHAGHDVRVFGHLNAAHTTQNARGREFTARAGQTTPATSHLNNEVVFERTFRRDQINEMARQLGLTDVAIARVFDDEAKRWLLRRMNHIRVPGGEVASFHMGFDPAGAVAACQAAWRAEGLEVIQSRLAPPPAAAAGRHR